MVASDCLKIDPALLPPSRRAPFFHALRAHHQIVVWKDLSDVNKEPLPWGCKFEKLNYTPIMTDIKAGSPELLRIVRCGCKYPCGDKCICRKADLQCSCACKECQGLTCSNALVIEPESDQNELEGTFLRLLNFSRFMIQQ